MKKIYRNQLPKGLEPLCSTVYFDNGEVIVDVEFKDKFEPKDGDFLISVSGNIFIYSNAQPCNKYSCSSYCGVRRILKDIYLHFSKDWTIKDGCRFATPEEKSAFLERLEKECGKRWNAEKKCLEDIYVPKFGDIVRVNTSIKGSRRNYMICIMPNESVPNYYISGFFNIANIDMGGNLSYQCGFVENNEIIPASESEKQELFDKLAKVWKRWNPDTKQLEDIRWRAEEGHQYWFVSTISADISTKLECNTPFDDERYDNGNYFRTPEAAQKVADQIKEIFKNSKAE